MGCGADCSCLAVWQVRSCSKGLVTLPKPRANHPRRLDPLPARQRSLRLGPRGRTRMFQWAKSASIGPHAPRALRACVCRSVIPPPSLTSRAPQPAPLQNSVGSPTACRAGHRAPAVLHPRVCSGARRATRPTYTQRAPQPVPRCRRADCSQGACPFNAQVLVAEPIDLGGRGLWGSGSSFTPPPTLVALRRHTLH